MNCPFCKGESRVIDSRPTSDGIRRRRECEECGRRFSTQERVVALSIKIIKAHGRPPEEFDPGKLRRSISRVSKGRNIPSDKVDQIASKIEGQLVDAAKVSFSSLELAAMLMQSLRELDEIVFSRYAVNYSGVDLRPRKVARESKVAEQFPLFE